MSGAMLDMISDIHEWAANIEVGSEAPERGVRVLHADVFRFSFYYYRLASAGGLPLSGGES